MWGIICANQLRCLSKLNNFFLYLGMGQNNYKDIVIDDIDRYIVIWVILLQ